MSFLFSSCFSYRGEGPGPSVQGQGVRKGVRLSRGYGKGGCGWHVILLWEPRAYAPITHGSTWGTIMSTNHHLLKAPSPDLTPWLDLYLLECRFPQSRQNVLGSVLQYYLDNLYILVLAQSIWCRGDQRFSSAASDVIESHKTILVANPTTIEKIQENEWSWNIIPITWQKHCSVAQMVGHSRQENVLVIWEVRNLEYRATNAKSINIATWK